MEQVLSGLEGCLVFIDDIVIFGATKEEHDVRLKKLQQRLEEFNVLLNKEKCVLGATSIEFLGHHLSGNGITPTSGKIESIRKFREPASSEEVRSFLGLVNYVGKFIPNLATVTEPLRALTRTGVKFEWGEAQKNSFQELKQILSNELTLGYYDAKDRTQVIADASPVGLGAVLIQFDKNGPRIISYASRSLSEVEQRYAQTEKEALALVWAVERFRFYLFGKDFELVTDHKPLEVIFAPKSKPCARIERWVMRLQSYRFQVIYKPGKSNIADPLSRLAIDTAPTQTRSDTDDDLYVRWILAHAEPKAVTLREIEEKSAVDECIQAVKKAIYEGLWTEITNPYKVIQTELCFSDNILLRGSRIVVPNELIDRMLELAHEGHPGMSKMKRRLRSKVWWPKMDQQVETFVKKCHDCVLVEAASPPEPMKRTTLPNGPWQTIAIDFCGPLPSGHYLFVVVDYFSRWVEVEVMTKIDSTETIKRLKCIFARFGVPITLKADNGSQFVSQEFKSYCKVYNIGLVSTIPYWPQQNGEVERQNRSILKVLTIAQNKKVDWRDELQRYLIMYRSTPHSVTLKSPAELMFNRNIKDKLPSISQPLEVDEEVRDRDKEKKQMGKEYGDQRRRAKQIDIDVGEKVFIKRQVVPNKLASTFDPTTFTVVKRNGSEVTVENTETKTQYRRNVAHVKRVPLGQSDDSETGRIFVQCYTVLVFSLTHVHNFRYSSRPAFDQPTTGSTARR